MKSETLKDISILLGFILAFIGFAGFAFSKNKLDGTWTNAKASLLIAGIVGILVLGYGMN